MKNKIWRGLGTRRHRGAWSEKEGTGSPPEEILNNSLSMKFINQKKQGPTASLPVGGWKGKRAAQSGYRKVKKLLQEWQEEGVSHKKNLR